MKARDDGRQRLRTITPMLQLYAREMRHRGGATHATSRISAMPGGYVTTWALFSVGAMHCNDGSRHCSRRKNHCPG
jgi:predicted metal-binding membrane protein